MSAGTYLGAPGVGAYSASSSAVGGFSHGIESFCGGVSAPLVSNVSMAAIEGHQLQSYTNSRLPGPMENALTALYTAYAPPLPPSGVTTAEFPRTFSGVAKMYTLNVGAGTSAYILNFLIQLGSYPTGGAAGGASMVSLIPKALLQPVQASASDPAGSDTGGYILPADTIIRLTPLNAAVAFVTGGVNLKGVVPAAADAIPLATATNWVPQSSGPFTGYAAPASTGYGGWCGNLVVAGTGAGSNSYNGVNPLGTSINPFLPGFGINISANAADTAGGVCPMVAWEIVLPYPSKWAH